MKLSEILKDWPQELEESKQVGSERVFLDDNLIFNRALTSCDREIDREALAKALFEVRNRIAWDDHVISLSIKNAAYVEADKIISTMPTWLKRI